MHATQTAYFSHYRSLKLTRDAQGVLVVEFHTNGGPLTFTAPDHTDEVVPSGKALARARERRSASSEKSVIGFP